jgi:DNA-binding response OmpR family regulator
MQESIDMPVKITSTSTIFLLEEDDDTQRGLKRNLRQKGFRVMLAVDMEDALEWLSNCYIHADLVLVDIVGKSSEEALERGRALRFQAKYDAQTPLVVMAEKFSPELEGTDHNVAGNDWICYLEDSEQLHRLLRRLIVRKAA